MTISSAPYTPPASNELVIRARAAAINPCDYAMQRFGILLENYPIILGCDAAGEVVEVGADLTEKFKVGDRVTAQADSTRSKVIEGDEKGLSYSALSQTVKNEKGEVVAKKEQSEMKGKTAPAYSAFQEYVVLQAPLFCKIPDSLKFEDATVLGLGFDTAASCLFMDACLGLEYPKMGEEKKEKGTLLVWGASSSVGSCGVQLATQAGYEVVGVASKRNHDMVKACGAVQCFDHGDSGLIDDAVEYLKGKTVVGAFDAISTESTLGPICEILDKAEAKQKLVAAVMPGAEQKGSRGVKITTNFGGVIVETGVGSGVWAWLEKALADGKMKCMPPAEVVGHGLDAAQKGCDILSQGVSAKKLVVTL